MIRRSCGTAMAYSERPLEDGRNREAGSFEDKIIRPPSPSCRNGLKNTELEEKAALSERDVESDEKRLLVGEETRFKICQNDDNNSIFYGLKRNYCKTFLFSFLVLLTGGLLYLVAHWKPKWKTKLTMSECSLKEAAFVILEDQYQQVTIVEIQKILVDENHKLLRNLSINSSCGLKKEAGFKIKKKHKKYQSLNSNKMSIIFVRYFEYRHQRYIWSGKHQCFDLVTSVEDIVSFNEAYEMAHGLTRQEQRDKLVIYDRNIIDVHVDSYLKLFISEAINPFYIFQLFSCIMWFFDDYYYYAGTIILISLVSILISVYQTRKHLVNLRNMIAKSSPVTVLRPNGEEESISSSELVHGDVIILPQNGCHLHCDAALLSGSAIVNESMLTGESIPVTKTPLPNPPMNIPELNEVIDPLKHKRHILFCGTELMQTRFYGKGKVLALVLRTGYYTTKGSLIRSILFPKPVGFKFFSDALKFLGVLSIFASLGFIYTVYIFLEHGAETGEILLRAFDVITIAVPPALPAAMSVGTIYALQRLKKVNIYCTSPSRINISGKIKLFCFDKTGTLTEDGLDIFGTVFAESGVFESVLQHVKDECHEGVHCMAACQSLTYIDGQLMGDPLDLKMFEATGWELQETSSVQETERYECLVPVVVRSNANNKCSPSHEESLIEVSKMPIEIAILKQFTFSSELQRMSVVTRKLGKSAMDVFAKGSPEMIAKLCLPESLPKDFDQVLKSYAEEGFRVIALGSKTLPESVKWHHVQHLVRNDIEKDLIFRGFLILKNMVKKETQPMIKMLIDSAIRVVMVTGDNMLTAVSVAKECQMVPVNRNIVEVSAKLSETSKSVPEVSYSILSQNCPIEHVVDKRKGNLDIVDFRNRDYHFALNGKTFSLMRNHLPELYERILVCGTIFARMLPVQKSQLVEDLQSIGYTVGMCGDGANDCGALKVAHAGVSLSEAEASIASPFTSKIPNISCVAEIIKEGRCALVTSFSLFKYMAMYSMVQYLSVLLLYSVRSNLGDFQYLYIDLLIIMPFAITMSHTGPYCHIVERRPLGSLVHPLVLSSLILQIIVQMTFQISAFFFIKTRGYYKSTDWFHAKKWHKAGHETQVLSYENTVLFYLTSFQYIFLAIVLSLGKPYRDNMLKNFWFVCTFVVLFAFTLTLVLYPEGFLKKTFQLVVIDDWNFTIALLCWAGCNAMVSYFIEKFLIKSQRFRSFLNRSRQKKRPRNRYKRITLDFYEDKSWPPFNGV